MQQEYFTKRLSSLQHKNCLNLWGFALLLNGKKYSDCHMELNLERSYFLQA